MLAAAEDKWAGKPENTWFLRLLIWTGARPEELAQLAARDSKRMAGHLCLHIHDEGENKLKNDASYRVVPIHPELLRLGLEAFVKAAKDRPLLFSTVKADGRSRLYSRMGGRLRRLLRNGAKIGDPRVVPYSIRHSFKDSMRLTGAPEEVVERIMGHRSPERRVARGYGNPDQIPALAKWISTADPLDVRRVIADFEDEEEAESMF